MTLRGVIRCATAAAIWGCAARACACAACFGAPDSGQTQGMNAAILTMLGVGGAVGGAIAAGIWKVLREEIASSTLPAPIQSEAEH